jgi:hypothetical protein
MKGKEEFVIIAVYVDDIVIASPSKAALESAKAELRQRFEMTDGGRIHHILGLRIEYNPEKGESSIGQELYVKKTLEKFRMSNCNAAPNPMDPSLPLGVGEPETGVTQTEYRSAVGALMYAAVCTRPDIAAAVGIVARHVEKPTKACWTAVKRIMRYLKGTADYSLKYRRCEDPELQAYCDADWAGDRKDRKSTTGFVLKLTNGTVG